MKMLPFLSVRPLLILSGCSSANATDLAGAFWLRLKQGGYVVRLSGMSRPMTARKDVYSIQFRRHESPAPA